MNGYLADSFNVDIYEESGSIIKQFKPLMSLENSTITNDGNSNKFMLKFFTWTLPSRYNKQENKFLEDIKNANSEEIIFVIYNGKTPKMAYSLVLDSTTVSNDLILLQGYLCKKDSIEFYRYLDQKEKEKLEEEIDNLNRKINRQFDIEH